MNRVCSPENKYLLQINEDVAKKVLSHATTFQLHNAQMLAVGPGSEAQPIHRDKWAFDYKELSEEQQKKSSNNWRKSFNGKIFDKLYKETIKRLEKNKNHSPCVAGSRFVEIFPDGLVRGCEVEKLWDISTIGKVEDKLDIVDILNSKKRTVFHKKCTHSLVPRLSSTF